MDAPRYHGKGTCSRCHGGSSVGPSISLLGVVLQYDNLSLVSSINKGTAKQTLVMHFLRSLWFLWPTMTLR